MISLSNMQAKIAATQKAYDTQKGSEAGSNMLVDGSGNGKVTTSIDDTVILLADGDDIVTANSNKNTVKAESGKNQIYINGNENYVEGGKDQDYIVSIGQHNDLNGGDGNDVMLSIGDYNKVNGGDGDNYIAFKGNHLYISDGDGDSSIRSLDFAIAEGNFEQYGKYLEDQIDTKILKTDVLLNTQINTEEVGGSSQGVENFLSKITDADKNYMTKNNIDLNAKNSDGSQKYYVVKSPTDGQYHIYAGSGSRYTSVTNSSDMITLSDIKTIQMRETTVKTYGDLQERNIRGLQDITIDAKNGADNIKVNVAKDITIKGIDVENPDKAKNIFVVGNIKLENDYSNIRQESTSKDYSVISSGASKFVNSDPLIVDFNRDGKISAKAGIGVDIDGNGYSDGAATDGDKMLAMSDMNDNGVVDGAEVFGNKTVNPFTGEALNAKNGFEALSLMAQEAEKHTGIKCMNENGDVDLQKLQEALKKVNVKLGFISDKNNTTIEDLAHVASINVNYNEQTEAGDVQRNQTGTYTDTDGQKHKANDVWFKLFGKNV